MINVDNTLLISILTLIFAVCNFIFSIYSYKQTYITPKKIESLQKVINIIINKINELKIENEDISSNIVTLEYMLYTKEMNEGCIDIFENWETILNEFRYSSNYKFLIKPAKFEFDELLSKEFYKQKKSYKELVVTLESKKNKLTYLHKTNFN